VAAGIRNSAFGISIGAVATPASKIFHSRICRRIWRVLRCAREVSKYFYEPIGVFEVLHHSQPEGLRRIDIVYGSPDSQLLLWSAAQVMDNRPASAI
jgi:hypothetical protein